MTQEDKDLLLRDLCARLPYGVKVMKQFKSQVRTLKSIDVENYRVYFVENDVNSPFGFSIENPIKFYQQIKPYLRPMSSMTEEEKAELKFLTTQDLSEFAEHITNGHGLSHDGLYMFDKLRQLDFCLSHHFDFRGLIPMGLALEATEGIYNVK